MKPKCLDLYCGGGGAGMGYFLAGFDVTGVDYKHQPRYPFTFIQADAMEYLREHWMEFDAIHASPVCKGYTDASLVWRKKGYIYPDQIEELREFLKTTGKPYVIENVRRAPLKNPFALNGGYFGLNVHRVRYFETNWDMPFILLPTMTKPVKMGRPVKDGDIIQPVGHFSSVSYAREQMVLIGLDKRNYLKLSRRHIPSS